MHVDQNLDRDRPGEPALADRFEEVLFSGGPEPAPADVRKPDTDLANVGLGSRADLTFFRHLAPASGLGPVGPDPGAC